VWRACDASQTGLILCNRALQNLVSCVGKPFLLVLRRHLTQFRPRYLAQNGTFSVYASVYGEILQRRSHAPGATPAMLTSRLPQAECRFCFGVCREVEASIRCPVSSTGGSSVLLAPLFWMVSLFSTNSFFKHAVAKYQLAQTGSLHHGFSRQRRSSRVFLGEGRCRMGS
jgi:hypothetical protein